jgi:hypothetical protein
MEYRCMECGKMIDENDGITTVDGEWVCDNDTCRTLDADNQAHIIVNPMYVIQPDRSISIKGGWIVVSHQSEKQKYDGWNTKLIKELPTYDIVAYDKDGEEVGESLGCIGNRALEFWFKYHVDRVRRLAILHEDLEMAKHNRYCYSNKDQYLVEYEEEVARIEILAQWIKKIRNNEL